MLMSTEILFMYCRLNLLKSKQGIAVLHYSVEFIEKDSSHSALSRANIEILEG